MRLIYSAEPFPQPGMLPPGKQPRLAKKFRDPANLWIDHQICLFIK